MLIETPALDEILAEVRRMKEAQEILEEVWGWLDPYDGAKDAIPLELRQRMNEYFGFDDSE